MCRYRNVPVLMCHWQDFAALDTNHTGVLKKSEIHRLLAKQLERAPTAREIADFLASADTDQDGVISLNEYIATVLSQRGFTVEVPKCHPCACLVCIW